MCDAFDRAFIDLRNQQARDPSGTHQGSYDREGAFDWIALTRDPGWTIFDECRNALDGTLRSTEWRAHWRPSMTIVDLGVGCGEKTAAILNAIMGFSPNARAIIADTSEAMLRLAFEALDAFRDTPFRIVPVGLDVVRELEKLRYAGLAFRELDLSGGAAFFMLGCTFANYPEDTTMRAFAGALMSGDLLVLGVECYRISDGQQKSAAAILSIYDAPSYFHYWGNACRRDIGDAQADESKIKTRVELTVDHPGAEMRVPRSLSVVTRLHDGGDSRVLMVSHRYDECELVRFVASYGFDLVLRSPSPRNPFYRHFVFKRI
jgi:SAM-dependent methyltransferase